MKILADVNVERALVQWLRSEGHDVFWAADLPASVPDCDLLKTAREESRVVLTHDRDFGELVFRHNLASQGVILMRFEAPLQLERLALLKFHWSVIEQNADKQFLVVTDRRIRIRPLP